MPIGAPSSLSPSSQSAVSARLTPSDAALASAARLWWIVAVCGQWLFVAYLLLFYGRTSLQGEVTAWNQVLSRGYVQGDSLGNLGLGLHLLFALPLLLGGALQFVPAMRHRWPRAHRWNGRLYMVSALFMALDGLALLWWRGGVVGDRWQHLGMTLNAMLIVACAIMAWRHARAGRLVAHRRWSIRLFLMVGGVWFFRIGLSLWLMVHQGPRGFDPVSFTGPFLTALAFGESLVPLLVAELQFRAGDGGAVRRAITVTTLHACTVLTAAGVLAATRILWWPRLPG